MQILRRGSEGDDVRRWQKSSVRELVPIAHDHGFYWGGHFSRCDGMHFEVARVQ